MDRKIGVTQMAFYRGWLQGMPLRDVADLYLETGIDLRKAKATLVWIQDTLRRAALRHGRRSEARLLRLRVGEGRTSSKSAHVPTIDEYRHRVDPSSFWSHDELMAQYREQYPEAFDRRGQRRAALLTRQVAALTWLEQLVVTAPVREDPLASWLDETLTARLHSVQLVTVGDLIALMTDHGYHWYTAVPGIGRTKATRLLRWLQSAPQTLGTLPITVLTRPRKLPSRATIRPLVLVGGTACPSIVPMDAALVPARVRTPAVEPLIDAPDDRAAIVTWLDARANSSATRRAYRKETERLLLWALNERRRTLGDLTVEDCTGYRDFLMGLGRTPIADWPWQLSQEMWCSPRHTARHHPRWRPFEGALSARSVLYALSVVRSFFAWLTAVAYISRDPWPAVAAPTALPGPAPQQELTRRLSNEAWQKLQACVASMPSPARERADALLWLAITTGLRRTELVSVTTDQLYSRPRKHGGIRWMLNVLGKGGKWRVVPMPDATMDRLKAWWVRLGMPSCPTDLPAGTPLVGRLDGQPLTSSGVAQLVVSLLQRGQAACRETGDWEAAQVLTKATTHWLRHTSGGMLGDAGVPPSQIHQLLGHASIATTSIYTTTQKEEFFDSVSSVFAPKHSE
jgi:site-specific recombinase XerD